MKFFTLCFLFLTFTILSAQKRDTTYITYKNISDLESIVKKEKIVQLKYVDSTFCYEVMVPSWLKLQETGTPEIFGGTLPALDGVENAIVLVGYKKDKFKSYADFKNQIIESDAFGQGCNMNREHIFMGKKDLGEVKGIGTAYKQYHMFKNLMYDSQFILIETKTAYLWLMFTATRDTYDKNLHAFEEFTKGFSIIK